MSPRAPNVFGGKVVQVVLLRCPPVPLGTSAIPLVVIFGLTLATEDDNEKSPFALVGIDKSHGAFAAASRGRLPVLGCFIYKVLPVWRGAAFWRGNKVAASYMLCAKSAENRGVFIHGKCHDQQSSDDVC